MQDGIATLALRPNIDAVQRALQWLEDIAERHSWPARTAFGLTLCLDEALTNVVSYAFDPPTIDSAIELACRVGENSIELELRDNGRPYDPTAGDPPALAACLDEAEPGGHGVRLMRHYLQALTYRREAAWNCLTMRMCQD